MQELDAVRHLPNACPGTFRRGSYIVDEHTVPQIIDEIRSTNASTARLGFKPLAIHLTVPRFSAIVRGKLQLLYAVVGEANNLRTIGGGVREQIKKRKNTTHREV